VVSQRHGSRPYWLRDVPSTVLRTWNVAQTDLRRVLQHVPQPESLAVRGHGWSAALTDSLAAASLTALNFALPVTRTLLERQVPALPQLRRLNGSLILETSLSKANAGIVNARGWIGAVLPGCPQLQHLDLCGLNVDDEIIVAAARHLPNLRHFGVRSGRVEDRGVIAVATHCPKLEHLDVGDCYLVTHRGIVEVARRCPNLRHLDVHSTRVSSLGIATVAANCANLEYLDVSEPCGMISDASVSAVARRCPNLKHLSLRDFLARDEVLHAVANHCPQLTHLDLSKNHRNFTDAALVAVARRCPMLRWLDLSETCGFTADGIEEFARNCPDLRHFACLDSASATEASVRSVARHCSKLESFGITFSSDYFVSEVSIASSVNVLLAGCPKLCRLEVSADLAFAAALHEAMERAQRVRPGIQIVRRMRYRYDADESSSSDS